MAKEIANESVTLFPLTCLFFSPGPVLFCLELKVEKRLKDKQADVTKVVFRLDSLQFKFDQVL